MAEVRETSQERATVPEVPENDFSTGYNDGIGISIDSQGQANTEVKNKKYEVPFFSTWQTFFTSIK